MSFTNKTSSALLIGCGKMGGALLNQWRFSEQVSFTVCDPADMTVADNVRHEKDAAALAGQSFDIVIVAIKPQLVDTVLHNYKHLLAPDAIVASIAAGCSAKRLKEALGPFPVIRIMPNLPAMIGKGVSGLYADETATPLQRDTIEHLMKLAGTAVWVDSEDGLDRVTAVAGSGPGYVFEFARTYVDAAMQLGFSEAQARDLVLGTIAGTIEMAQNSKDTLETLRNNVTSKNGTTEAGLRALNLNEACPLTKLLEETTSAAYTRAVELR